MRLPISYCPSDDLPDAVDVGLRPCGVGIGGQFGRPVRRCRTGRRPGCGPDQWSAPGPSASVPSPLRSIARRAAAGSKALGRGGSSPSRGQARGCADRRHQLAQVSVLGELEPEGPSGVARASGITNHSYVSLLSSTGITCGLPPKSCAASISRCIRARAPGALDLGRLNATAIPVGLCCAENTSAWPPLSMGRAASL